MIADGFAHVGQMYPKKLKKYLNKLLCKDKNSLDDAAKIFYYQKVLSPFEHGKKIDSFLSRHAILHEGDTNFGTVENSLKCILFFDYLQDKFKFVSVGNGKCYHLPGCHIVLKSRKEELNHYDSEFEAKNKGKIPCKICMPSKK